MTRSTAGTELPLQMEQRVRPEEVVKVARAAGDHILGVYHGDSSAWKVERKGDSSPVTLADHEANAVICNGLSQLAPHVPVVSEESREVPFDTRQHYQYSFCVDPLDGTKEFVKRNGEFTVNIALLRGNRPILGVVHTPVREWTHWAAEGIGAFKRIGRSGSDQPIECASFEASAPGLTLVGSVTHTNRATKDFLKYFKEPSFTQMGSSLKLMLVAEGQAHVYPRLAPTCEWDTAAAQAVVEQAGGCVLQAGECDDAGDPLQGVDWRQELDKEQPLIYNKQSLKNPMFVCFGNVQGSKLPSSSSYCSMM